MGLGGWGIALGILVGATACSSTETPYPASTVTLPTYSPVGHWREDANQTGEIETLWIEADGTYTARTQNMALLASASLYYLSSGSWTFRHSDLFLQDAKAGPHGFMTMFQSDGGMTLLGTIDWTFHLDTVDGG